MEFLVAITLVEIWLFNQYMVVGSSLSRAQLQQFADVSDVCYW
ncbi:MAG: hypothetical protein ACOX08_00450 [Methanobacterium sp.]